MFNNIKIATTAGFAMFAMFFGSGNLVFPLIIGAKTTDHYLTASLGLMLTGVLVPFLGLFSMVLFEGNKDKYFGLLGKLAPFTLSLLILSLIGPFGVIPRCILVSFGGINLIYPNMPLYLFSAIFVFLVIIIIWQKDKIIPIMGKYLGPLKIGGIVLIIAAAVIKSPGLFASTTKDQNPFMLGITQGYQTMDLMAAFFFSITIVEYLNRVCKTREETIKTSIFASLIGGTLIGLVYFGFIYLGAHYAQQLIEVNPEQYLAAIAQLTLGEYASIIVAFTILLSCLVTGATLTKLFADFITTDVSRNKISWPVAMITTILISYALSLTGFMNIASLLHSILTYAYPALISLSITSIMNQYFQFRWVKETFWLTLVLFLLYTVI